jgi:glucokinase
VGVGFGGPVDSRSGRVLLSPRMRGWEQFPLQERFEDAFDATTLVDNDANLIALAEATFGVGKDVEHLFYLHLSSGVGGGMVLDGRLYHGATTTAGEIGHAVVGMGWDGVGQPATLEQLLSISGLLTRAGELGLRTDNLNDIFGANPIGRRVVQETVTILSMRLAQLVALLDPQMIVLGGIVVRIGGEPFIAALREEMQRYIMPQFARPVQLLASVLGPDSIAIGGLALALESLRD